MRATPSAYTELRCSRRTSHVFAVNIKPLNILINLSTINSSCFQLAAQRK